LRISAFECVGYAAIACCASAAGNVQAGEISGTPAVVSEPRYSAAAIARGRQFYNDNCQSCHGVYARGDGSLARGLPIKPADLVVHFGHHPENQIFAWIKFGIPGTPMPPFESRLSDADVRDIIQFLRLLSDQGPKDRQI
jgi:mono/diheme cytochrome c family protein